MILSSFDFQGLYCILIVSCGELKRSEKRSFGRRKFVTFSTERKHLKTHPYRLSAYSKGSHLVVDFTGENVIGVKAHLYLLSLLSDEITSIVSFRIVNRKYNELLDSSSSKYSDMQVNIQRNVSKCS